MPGFEPKPHWWVASDLPCPLSSFDTHARWQPVTQSTQSRRSLGKIGDCEQFISPLHHPCSWGSQQSHKTVTCKLNILGEGTAMKYIKIIWKDYKEYIEIASPQMQLPWGKQYYYFCQRGRDYSRKAINQGMAFIGENMVHFSGRSRPLDKGRGQSPRLWDKREAGFKNKFFQPFRPSLSLILK